jgi:hypothetical protein
MKKPTMRNISRALWFLIAPLVMPAVVHAVTYPFPVQEPAPLKVEAVLTVGAKLYLFQSGTDEVRKTITVNDVLTVYREYPPDFSIETREVGKVRILAPLGDYYLDGEVAEGEVKAGDLAKKSTIAFFVTSIIRN